MKIAVLDLTTHPEKYLGGLPRIYTQIDRWLSPCLPEAELIAYDIAEGGQKLPSTADFDGLVVSGSELGVYDEAVWMQPLRQLLKEAKAAAKPVFGICFGHQIMADTFGGKAEKAEVGSQLGARSFTDANGSKIDAYVWHQDQVTKVPPGASIVASASYCPVAALDYDFPAMSVQFHPEYSENHLRELYDRLPETILSQESHKKAVESFKGVSVPADLHAQEVATFFRKHI